MGGKKNGRWWGVLLGSLVLPAAFGPAEAAVTLLHEFSYAGGQIPHGALTLSGPTLYGMRNGGGANGKGVVFGMNTNGSGFGLLYEFNGSDGSDPHGSLTLSGSTLYGMTSGGGTFGKGVAFQHDLNPVPEAPPGLLLGIGSVLLLPLLRRRRKAG
jgi:hypothetical protein